MTRMMTEMALTLEMKDLEISEEEIRMTASVPESLITALYWSGKKSTLDMRLAVLELPEIASQISRLEMLRKKTAERPVEVTSLPYDSRLKVSRMSYDCSCIGGWRIVGKRIRDDSAFIGWATIASEKAQCVLPAVSGSELDVGVETLRKLDVGTVIDRCIDIVEFGFVGEAAIQEDEEKEASIVTCHTDSQITGSID